MAVHSFEDLLKHVGHKVVVVVYGSEVYGIANVSCECETCDKVEYVSIIDDSTVTVVFSDGSVETFIADPLINGLNGEEIIYKPIVEIKED